MLGDLHLGHTHKPPPQWLTGAKATVKINGTPVAMASGITYDTIEVTSTPHTWVDLDRGECRLHWLNYHHVIFEDMRIVELIHRRTMKQERKRQIEYRGDHIAVYVHGKGWSKCPKDMMDLYKYWINHKILQGD